MTQTSKIAGALIIAWIVFITTRGKLPDYLSMLGLSAGNNASGCLTASGSGIVNKATNLLSGGTSGSTPSTPV